MACEKRSYMLLSPEKVGVVDLFRILIHSDVHKREFVDCSEKGEESFERRWIMFVSILAQKLLLLVAKPMSWIGLVLEFWLNLLSSNQNLGGLLINCFRGKVVMPDKASGSFVSFIGNLDKRVELDKSISPGDSEYYAALSMMASKASYENKAYIQTTVTHHWQREFLGFYDFWNDHQGRATTQAFMLRDRDTIVVAFRGTEPFNADDWCSDIDLSWYGMPRVGKIHVGFMKALGLQKNLSWPKELDSRRPLAYYAIREKLRSLLGKNDKVKYVLTGHSLGGALAILFPAILAMHEETRLMERLEGVYTFGQPRVGDDKFGEFMERVLEEHQINYFRFVYGNDIVPRLPYDNSTFMFKHFGRCCYFNSKYEGKIVQEEPNKNYFSPLNTIPMMMNAWYELIRSFTIDCKNGLDYKEGLLLRTFRVIGLLIPGAPAHSPQDYVNATRLGGSQLFQQYQQ
ncbi:triacylglycerol lipase OBL1-like [Syzygium oleosum]|uniref:triacylglycerol lipase OBL1-like n=1 Tax=Syzygium oleosum TaxID=219896 RepID=UPI0024BB4189|nr:triacylglycerol lipase OBL1-like [Syzygium oleosum]